MARRRPATTPSKAAPKAATTTKKSAREAKARMKHHDAVAKRFEAFRHARDVLRVVRAVPTCFVQFDHGVRVGGFPIERFTLVHGASGHGKSLFTLGLVKSFLTRNHFALYVDAERTTPVTWAEELMGRELAHHPRFFAIRPDSYEDTIAQVRAFLNHLAEAKEAGEVDADTSAVVVVDSLRKLVPRDLMKEILQAEVDAKEITGGRDRRAQLQAKMNAAWMDEIVPLLERSGAAFIAIAREMADPDADMWAKKFGNDYKIGGGTAIIYEASLRIRIERDRYIVHGEGKDKRTYGERHKIVIKKTKVSGKDDREIVCYFHSSNGVLVPSGFDTARDVLELARVFKVVEVSGASYSFEGERIAMGEHNAVKVLHETPMLLSEIERRVRAAFEKHEPVMTELQSLTRDLLHDEDGVVIE